AIRPRDWPARALALFAEKILNAAPCSRCVCDDNLSSLEPTRYRACFPAAVRRLPGNLLSDERYWTLSDARHYNVIFMSVNLGFCGLGDFKQKTGPEAGILCPKHSLSGKDPE